MKNRVLVFLDGFLKQVVSNVLCEAYREGHTDWLIGGTPTLPGWVAVGGSDTPAGIGDTELAIELNRVAVTHKFTRRRYIARFNITWHPLEPPGLTAITLKEIGLFDAGPIPVLNYSLEDWTGGLPDNWTLAGAGSSVASSTTCYQGQLSAQVTAGGGAEATLYQQVSGDISAYKQKRVCFWAAIRHDVASKATVYIDDGIGGKNYATTRIYWDTATSKWVKEAPGGTVYHSGTVRWELLRVEKIIDANATKIEFGLSIVAGGGSPYFDWTNLVQQGNLWARSNIDLSKQDGQVLNIIWEVSSYITDEEGEVIRKTFAHEELAPTNAAAISLTSSVYRPTGETPASYALITVEDAANRHWRNGGTPTTASGHLTNTGGVIELYSLEDIENFSVIATTGTPSKLKISYGR